MNNRSFKLIPIDAVSSVLALYLSFLLRFEFAIPPAFQEIFNLWIPWFVTFQIIVFQLSGLYARIWRYTSLFDLYAILIACATSVGISSLSLFLLNKTTMYPRSVLLLYFILNTLIVIGTRLIVRVYYSHYHEDSLLRSKTTRKALLLIGAGKTGEKIAKEILSTSRRQYKLVGYLDDNIDKHGALLHGRKIFGSVKDLPNLNIAYDELLITSPSASGDQIRRIIKICKLVGKRYKIIPGIGEMIDGEISIHEARDVSYTDLLGRKEVSLDKISIKTILRGKRILITGAGGSIGFELVKQCLTFKPAEIICLDINEEKIYDIEQFKNINQGPTVIKTVLCSINNIRQLEKVFLDNQPQIVFHAAAYKHVPIQEHHPWTAVRTNFGGTLNLVNISDQYLVDKFVLVSTDKAVNPTNVMGATKRASEKLILSYNQDSNTNFMAVRFGNVLGSSGSAIPTFQKQIKQGGPITITHPEMTRYFMSLQEASQLILQCGALASDGEIFLLEMGKPIKILQIAKDLIRLSGLEPEIDIPIVYTGLRPGEKLYEELQLINEVKVTTKHKKIMILKEKQQPIPWGIFQQSANELIKASNELNRDKIIIILKQILPTYNPDIFETNSNKKPINFSIKGEA